MNQLGCKYAELLFLVEAVPRIPLGAYSAPQTLALDLKDCFAFAAGRKTGEKGIMRITRGRMGRTGEMHGTKG